MYQQVAPISLSHRQLDEFLAAGWYRMGQTLFTLDYVMMDEYIRVFWLRFGLRHFRFEKKHRQLMARCNRFKTNVLPLELRPEHEILYAEYRRSIDFDGAAKASLFLFDKPLEHVTEKGIFDSRMVEVRDGDRLIAVGFFDVGKTASAGIMNFYHPEYRKFSLGKFLMLKKIEFSMQAQLDWYYPGYIGYKLPKFDYKLFPGPAFAEILDPMVGDWLPWSAEKVEELAESQFFLSGLDFGEGEEE